MSNDTRRSISEGDPEIEDWFKVAPTTPEELRTFVAKLLGDYDHDYGSICHAAAAAAVAAVRTINADPTQGGITGFQAGAITWEFIKRWMRIEAPAQILEYREMLYPHYGHKFRTISLDTFTWLQAQAKEKLERSQADGDQVSADVLEHWKCIVDGHPPFGFEVEK